MTVRRGAVAALALAGCLILPLDAVPSVPPPAGQRLLWFVGSGTLGERMVPALAQAWLKSQKQARNVALRSHGHVSFVTGILPDGSPAYIEVHATGSGDCFESLLSVYVGTGRSCDIGVSSRRVTPAEADQIEEKSGSDLFTQGTEPGEGCEHPIGIDGIAIVAHPEVPVERISFSELRAIYSGKLTNWNQLADWRPVDSGTAGLPILPVRRKEPSGTLDTFIDRIKPASGPLRKVLAFTSSADLVAKVAATSGAIGFVGHSFADGSAGKRIQVYNDLPPMEAGPDEASFPDPETIRQDQYPLSRAVYFYTHFFIANPEVRPFIRFALSAEGQAVIAEVGKLIKVEGTLHEIANSEPGHGSEAPPAIGTTMPADGRERKVILRLHGSNTVGAACAVNLAHDFLMTKRRKPSSPVEDLTSQIATPEGEQALAHDLVCDLDDDGVWEAIEIRPTGSSDAFRDLRSGGCDIGMSSRPITESENRDLIKVCANLIQPAAQFALGLDALAIIVSKDNPVEQLTIEKLRQVFLGEITDWAALGGSPEPIRLHSRADRSGTYKAFCDAVLGGRAVAASATRHAENSFVTAAVAAEPAAIGFVPMADAGSARTLAIGQAGSKSFHHPTAETVRAGRYPPLLCRYVYLYVPASPPQRHPGAQANWPAAREFAEFSHGWRGQVIVANSGFITETVMTDAGGELERRSDESMPGFISRVRELERQVLLGRATIQPKLTDGEICPRLLFEFNQWTLTRESVNIINRKLGPWLRMYPGVVAEGLVTEGWADSVGSDDTCRQVSLKRAESVANYLADALNCRVRAVGMGKSFDPPNNSEVNKQQNRRVAIKAAALVEAGR